MRCEEAKRALNEYLDGTLVAPVRTRIERHLEGCPACAAEARATRNLLLALGDDPAREVSAGFEASLAARLEAARPAGPILAWLARLRIDLAGRARPALAAAGALAAAVTLWTLRPTDQPHHVQPPAHQVLEVVRQHEAFADADVVQYSITQSTEGVIGDLN